MRSGQLHSHFGVLARLAPSSQDALGRKPYASSKDFLIAFAGEHLHLFQTAVNRTCPCHTKQTENTAAATSSREDFASWGFHCPHATGFECYEAHTATIPMCAIEQVLMTYRTTVAVARSPNTKLFAANTNSNAVAARTQDLLLKFMDGTLLWLTFEHNLLRGGFLEALMSSASAKSSSACIDVDYIDLNEHSDLATTVDLEQAFPPIAIPLVSDSQQHSSFYVRRDALRCVLYDKIQITLQLAQESTPGTGSSDGELMCHYMLGTAMTLAKALDEPDLVAFSWLASASINAQDQSLDKRELAQAQATYSIKIAQTNSLAYLLFLALRCASDSSFQLGDAQTAKAYLLQAATVVPDTLETRLRMELHRRIQELRVWIDSNHPATATLTSSGPFHRPETPFNLWAHCTFGSSPRGPRGRQHSAPAMTPKDLLLRRVAKSHAIRHGDGFACYVGLVDANAGSNSIPQRLRVFIDDDSCTLHWLEREVLARLPNTLSALCMRVDTFYGPNAETKTIVKDRQLRGVVLSKTNETIWARLVPVQDGGSASKARASSSASMISGSSASTEASIMCSLCQKRISIDAVEAHSESCY